MTHNAMVAVLAGSLKGKSMVISAPEFSIGREPSNSLCVNANLISRRHAVIKTDSASFTIVDLNSLNGTYVNGVPIKERTLQSGDRIEIGDCVLLFLLENPESGVDELTASGMVRFDEEAPPGQTVVQLRAEDSVYLNPVQTTTNLPVERIATDLKTVLRICREIQATRGEAAVERKLLELIFEAAPADSGAIIMSPDASSDPTSMLGWSRRSGAGSRVTISRSVVRQVLQKGTAWLSKDIMECGPADAVQSLVRRRVSSVLAVPLLLFEKVIGAIYLETKDPEIGFDEGHLQLMMGVAGLASVALDNARHVEWVEGENRKLQSDVNLQHSMVGESPRMRAVYQFAAKVAPVDSTVLIRGESGTGKELVARAVHANSPRSGKPFVAINCAALTETLLESELFGHERGAFTGAIAQKKGKLELANGGTVFLDEIGEMAPALQAKLLRALQERQFERVGGAHPVRVDIRIIAATNRDLEKAVHDGAFRQDLYYRLNVLTITMPPLRERREDIPLLAGYFAMRFSNKSSRPIRGVSPEARECLLNYDWPGNVRELENAIERAVVLGTTEVIMPEDLPEALLETQAIPGVQITEYHQAVKETKRRLVVNALERAAGNYTEAAQILGVHPNNLHRLMRSLDLKVPPKK